MKSEPEKWPLSKLDHIGVVVRDMDRAIEYYQALGIGPFEPYKPVASERWLYGKPVSGIKNIVKIAQMAPWGIRFELIQPVEGESIFTEFLERGGEGVHHLDYLVDDVDEATAVMVEKGFKPVFSGKYADGGAFAHFDTDKTGGLTVELCSLSTDYS